MTDVLRCFHCGREEVRPEQTGLRNSWYTNGFSRRLNPELTADIEFAVCLTCRRGNAGVLDRAWAWARNQVKAQSGKDT